MPRRAPVPPALLLRGAGRVGTRAHVRGRVRAERHRRRREDPRRVGLDQGGQARQQRLLHAAGRRVRARQGAAAGAGVPDPARRGARPAPAARGSDATDGVPAATERGANKSSSCRFGAGRLLVGYLAFFVSFGFLMM